MIAQYHYMVMPGAACIILAGVLAYLGIHVLERKVIFVDLALAQISALGFAVAFLAGHDPHSHEAYIYSLAFAIGGAALFALSRLKKSNQPQEAFIGVIYVVCAAMAILVVDKAPHGAEHIKEILEGSIVWVTVGDVIKAFAIYGAAGLVYFLFRKPFFKITFDPDAAERDGMRIRAWDFLFYATFGIVVTSAVQMAGILMVFTFLIVPSLISALFFQRVLTRWLAGWAISSAVSLVGLLMSYDRPTGPMIITLMGLTLLVAVAIRQFKR